MVDATRVKTIMASVLEVDPSTITDNASMDTVPSWDSLRHMNLVLALEEGFGVSFPDDDAANVTSYALITLVLNELGAG
jgi:acyl carrier protein